MIINQQFVKCFKGDLTVRFFSMLFSILFKGNHTIALVKGLGDYETLKEDLKMLAIL